MVYSDKLSASDKTDFDNVIKNVNNKQILISS